MASSSKSIDSMKAGTSAKPGRSDLFTEHEYEKLQETVAVLKDEGSRLNFELRRLSEECGKLKDENDSIEEELTQIYGADAISDIEAMRPDSDGECSSDEQKASSENKWNNDQSTVLEFSRIWSDERKTASRRKWSDDQKTDLELHCGRFAEQTC